MKDKKFFPFWMEKEKREIIENYAECVYDREVLLERIEKAIEYIEEAKNNEENDTMEYYNYTKEDLLNILRGEE